VVDCSGESRRLRQFVIIDIFCRHHVRGRDHAIPTVAQL
jgi:hypothetical protein